MHCEVENVNRCLVLETENSSERFSDTIFPVDSFALCVFIICG